MSLLASVVALVGAVLGAKCVDLFCLCVDVCARVHVCKGLVFVELTCCFCFCEKFVLSV